MSVNSGAAWTLSPAQIRRLRLDCLWQVADNCLAKLRELANPTSEQQHFEAFMERIKLAGVYTFLDAMEASNTWQALACKTIVDYEPSWENESDDHAPINFLETMKARPAPLIQLPELGRETWEKFLRLIERSEEPDVADKLSIELSMQYPETTPSKWREWARIIEAATEGPTTLQQGFSF